MQTHIATTPQPHHHLFVTYLLSKASSDEAKAALGRKLAHKRTDLTITAAILLMRRNKQLNGRLHLNVEFSHRVHEALQIITKQLKAFLFARGGYPPNDISALAASVLYSLVDKHNVEKQPSPNLTAYFFRNKLSTREGQLAFERRLMHEHSPAIGTKHCKEMLGFDTILSIAETNNDADNDNAGRQVSAVEAVESEVSVQGLINQLYARPGDNRFMLTFLKLLPANITQDALLGLHEDMALIRSAMNSEVTPRITGDVMLYAGGLFRKSKRIKVGTLTGAQRMQIKGWVEALSATVDARQEKAVLLAVDTLTGLYSEDVLYTA